MDVGVYGLPGQAQGSAPTDVVSVGYQGRHKTLPLRMVVSVGYQGRRKALPLRMGKDT